MNILRRQSLSWRRHFVILAVIALALVHHSGMQGAQANRAPYKHAYYLFLDGSGAGCEACYVPLLITQNTLESVAAGTLQEGMVIITYERDSIWQSKGTVPLHAKDIQIETRVVQLNSKKYRYQEIDSKEVVKLLENPIGSIPISRPAGPGMGLEKSTREELIRAFKQLWGPAK